jgi:hypothetical protein
MKNVNKHTVEELIDVGSFSSLSEAQKRVVLKEMTAEEFDMLRNVMLAKTPFISASKFAVLPNSHIQKELLEKMKSKPAKKSVVKQLYIYGSSVAAILILLFLTYTYFFTEQTKAEDHSIVEITDEIVTKKIPKEPQTETIQPNENEQNNLMEVKTDVKKRKVAISQPHIKKEKGSADDPEEFEFLTTELGVNEEDDADATLAYYSDESERVFHYYTRLE